MALCILGISIAFCFGLYFYSNAMKDYGKLIKAHDKLTKRAQLQGECLDDLTMELDKEDLCDVWPMWQTCPCDILYNGGRK